MTEEKGYYAEVTEAQEETLKDVTEVSAMTKAEQWRLMDELEAELWGGFVCKVYKLVNDYALRWYDVLVWLKVSTGFEVDSGKELADWVTWWMDAYGRHDVPAHLREEIGRQVDNVWSVGRLDSLDHLVGDLLQREDNPLQVLRMTYRESALEVMDKLMEQAKKNRCQIKGSSEVFIHWNDFVKLHEVYKSLLENTGFQLKPREVEAIRGIVESIVKRAPFENVKEDRRNKCNLIHCLIYSQLCEERGGITYNAYANAVSKDSDNNLRKVLRDYFAEPPKFPSVKFRIALNDMYDDKIDKSGIGVLKEAVGQEMRETGLLKL